MPEAVIGIDQSLTACGIAAIEMESGDPIAIEVLSPAATGPVRLLGLQYLISEFCAEVEERFTVAGLTMEGYSFYSKQGREVMGECGAAVKLGLLRHFGMANKVAYPTVVSPDGVKKFATGKGNSSVKKSAIAAYVQKKWGLLIEDDNMADAYVLSRIARDIYSGRDSDMAYENEVVGKLTRHTEWSPLSKQAATISKGRRKRFSA